MFLTRFSFRKHKITLLKRINNGESKLNDQPQKIQNPNQALADYFFNSMKMPLIINIFSEQTLNASAKRKRRDDSKSLVSSPKRQRRCTSSANKNKGKKCARSITNEASGHNKSPRGRARRDWRVYGTISRNIKQLFWPWKKSINHNVDVCVYAAAAYASRRSVSQDLGGPLLACAAAVLPAPVHLCACCIHTL